MRKLEFIENNFTQNITNHPEMPLLRSLSAELQLTGAISPLTDFPKASTSCNALFAVSCKRIHHLTINKTRQK